MRSEVCTIDGTADGSVLARDVGNNVLVSLGFKDEGIVDGNMLGDTLDTLLGTKVFIADGEVDR